MVHLETLHANNTYFNQHKGIILDPHHRYAIISNNSHSFFDTAEDLYQRHPQFKPGAPAFFGTLPKLVDIAKELNLPVYQKEVLEEKVASWDDKFVALMEEHELLAEEQAKLEAIVVRK